MKLIIMTKPTFFVEEDKIITSLFDEGLENLHLSKPESTPIYSERLLTLLPDEYYNKISVHDHFYLKEEYKLRGIHLDDYSTLPPAGYKGHVSRSCDNAEDIRLAKKNSDYIFLNSSFCNKEGDNDGCLRRLEDAAKSGYIDKKVYAIGGVNLDNIKTAKSLGFGGVVVCEDLWNRFDIHHETDYRELIGHFEKLKKAAY